MIPLAAILSIGEKVLDKFLPNPEAKAQAQAKLMEMAAARQAGPTQGADKDMQSAREPKVQIADQRSLQCCQDCYAHACAWYLRVTPLCLPS
jgi:sensor domain CHASE-containing protein